MVNALNGKRLSVLGDSISTYKGVSDDASAVPSLIYNPYFYREPFPLDKTYWSIVLKELGMNLCVNNSWSGGNLSGRDDPSSGVSRANFLNRADGQYPDVVIIFMGINDLGRGVPTDVFRRDYETALRVIRQKNPDAAILCVNLPDRDPCFKPRVVYFNTSIAEAVQAVGDGCFVADLYGSPLNNDTYYYNTVDGLHPDEDGMKMIARVVIDALLEYFK